MKFSKKDKDGTFKGVFVAYFILILHIFLLAGAGIVVMLFRGFVQYLPWVFGGTSLLIVLGGYIFYRKAIQARRSLNDLMGLPAFQGRSVEVKLLGGLVSITADQIEGKQKNHLLAAPEQQGQVLLDHPEDMRMRQLTQLSEMLEKDLITRYEYDTAKERLFDSFASENLTPQDDQTWQID